MQVEIASTKWHQAVLCTECSIYVMSCREHRLLLTYNPIHPSSGIRRAKNDEVLPL